MSCTCGTEGIKYQIYDYGVHLSFITRVITRCQRIVATYLILSEGIDSAKCILIESSVCTPLLIHIRNRTKAVLTTKVCGAIGLRSVGTSHFINSGRVITPLRFPNGSLKERIHLNHQFKYRNIIRTAKII